MNIIPISLAILSLSLLSEDKAADQPRRDLGPISAKVTAIRCGRVTDLSISPKGDLIASAGENGVMIFKYPAGSLNRELVNPLEIAPSIIAFSKDGRRLVGAGRGLWVWDGNTGKLLLAEKFRWQEEPGRVRPEGRIIGPLRPRCRPAISSDGNRVYAPGASDDVMIIDTTTGKAVGRFTDLNSPPVSLSISPDGRLLAVGTRYGLQVLDVEAKALLSKGQLPPARAVNEGYRVTFARDGKHVFVFGPSGESKGQIKPEGFSVWGIDSKKFTVRVAALSRGRVEFDHAARIGDSDFVVGCRRRSNVLAFFDVREGRTIGHSFLDTKLSTLLVGTADGKCFVGAATDCMIIINANDLIMHCTGNDNH